jgi:serine protease AprX
MTYKIRVSAAACLIALSSLGLRGAGVEHRARLSDDLLGLKARRTSARARVIVHGDDATLEDVARRHGVRIVRRLAGAAVFAANSSELESLSADSAIDHISGDALVQSWMSVSDKATAADQTRAGSPGGLLGIGAVRGDTGQGIGVAIIDSGISPHPALANRVVANVSLVTGDALASDTFGHGTHVAGAIAGNGGAAQGVTSLYTGGIAPGAKLINVRVLGPDGVGLTSDVIAGIDWAIAHSSAYNIRVINLSLGHPVTEPAATDPLCEAVERAVRAGIVVVAAAGNYGVADDGSPILGGITSPGNSPLAITVGSLNTWGTVNRSDDTVAAYSSRGPTRFDFAVKPDLAAPGNKIISLEANGSFLPTMYPYLHKAGASANAYMQLSGTSMAAPIVSGAAALLLQGVPSMTPAQVKLALQSGATYVHDGGLMGAGAGSVNIWASRKNSASGLLGSVLTSVVGGLTSTSSGASFWDEGTLAPRLYGGLGVRLLSLLQAPLYWLNPSMLRAGDLNLLGLGNPLASITPKWLLYGQVAGWTSEQSIMWGTNIQNPQGQSIMWGTSYTTDGTSIMWGTSMTSPDPR